MLARHRRICLALIGLRLSAGGAGAQQVVIGADGTVRQSIGQPTRPLAPRWVETASRHPHTGPWLGAAGSDRGSEPRRREGETVHTCSQTQLPLRTRADLEIVVQDGQAKPATCATLVG